MEVTKDIIDGPYCKLIPIVLKRYEKYMISNSKTKLFLYRSNLKIEKLFVKSFFYKLFSSFFLQVSSYIDNLFSPELVPYASVYGRCSLLPGFFLAIHYIRHKICTLKFPRVTLCPPITIATPATF